VDSLTGRVNAAAAQVADLNVRIRSTLAAGGSANEMIDRRSTLTTSLANLVGATVREAGDGTVIVQVGGNQLVSAEKARTLTAAGPRDLAGLTAAGSAGVHLEWSDKPGIAVGLDGGQIAGSIALLSPADGGTGGSLAEAAASYNGFATALAAQVNAIHEQGATSAGVTSTPTAPLDFFRVSGDPAALGLSVVPTAPNEIATATPGAGNYDGSIADAISQLGTAPDSPDVLWSTIVTKIGVASKTDGQQSSLAGIAATNASSLQLANASVDSDEENMNMITFQHAYQGAARMMTAVDEMLDTLINHTGSVGR
jgi:flagellar hook-associated protein 1 FlgK